MKCNKCGSEWKTDASRSSSIKVCPFCQEKIEAEKSGDWKYFDNTKDLLAHIAAEYGLDALFSKKYLSDHASPMLPPGQKKLVSETFSCGAVKILQDNVNSDQSHKEIAVKQAVKKLTDLMFSQESAERVVWEFTNAIGWGMSEPQDPNQQKGSTPTPQPPVRVVLPSQPPPATSTDPLMTRAWLFAEDGDWKEAADYFNKVLDIAPTYAYAYLGLLCVDLKAPKEDKLLNVKDPGSITNHKYYKRAIADTAIKTQLEGYVQIIKDRIDAEQKAAADEAERKRKAAEEATRKKRVQDAYDNADKIMNNAQSLDDFRKAITAFSGIDSNYQDINSQIKSKITACELKIRQITAGLDKVLAPLREKFDPKAKAEKQAKLQEQRKVDKERIDTENAKTKADVGAKCSQIQQKFSADHKAWQEEYNRVKAAYDTEYNKWENEAKAVKVEAEQWKSQGLCPHCGGTLKGLFSKKCTKCGKASGEPIKISAAPSQPNYPAEPKIPAMPTFTSRALDESIYVIEEDSAINQHVTFAGIEWRILDVQGSKLLLISEKILEKRPYNVEQKDISWENCTLRKYLNSEFFNKLGAIKPAIAEIRNNNPNNPWFGTAGGNTTTDKMFLLSLDELIKYFGDSGDLRNKKRKDDKGNISVTGLYLYDQYNGARIAEGASCWWLRSPGWGSNNVASVYSDGIVTVNGRPVNDGSVGFRPALWLNL